MSVSVKTAGRLIKESSRTGGKLIATWLFRMPTLGEKETASEAEVQVRVSLLDTDDGLAFRANFDDFEPLRDSDIQRLHSRVEALLRERSSNISGVDWQDWLRVKVIPSGRDCPGRSHSAGLQIVVDHIKRAVDPLTGKAYLLSENGLWAKPMPESTDLKVALDRHRRTLVNGDLCMDGADQVSYVPASTVNLAALSDARSRIHGLCDQLAEALIQENVDQTLAALTLNLPALPPSSGPTFS